MKRGLLIFLAVLMPPIALLVARMWLHAGLNFVLCIAAILAHEIPAAAVALSLVALVHAVWAIRRPPAPQAT